MACKMKWTAAPPREMSLSQRTSGLQFKGLPENKGARRHFHIFIMSDCFSCRSWTPSPPPPLPRDCLRSSFVQQEASNKSITSLAHQTPQLQTGWTRKRTNAAERLSRRYRSCDGSNGTITESIKHQEMGRRDFVSPELPPDVMLSAAALVLPHLTTAGCLSAPDRGGLHLMGTDRLFVWTLFNWLGCSR